MLADWYFCSAIKMAPAQTAIYLDIFESLRFANSRGKDLNKPGEEVVSAALNELLKAEPWIIEYAFPLLLELGRYHGPEEQVGERVRRLVRAVVDEVSHPSLQAQLRQLADSALVPQGNTEKLLSGLDQAAESVAALTPREPLPQPYIDLAEFLPEVILLSILFDRAAVDAPAVGLRVVGDGALPLIERALRNEYGRLPLLLAARTVARVTSPGSPALLGRLWDSRAGAAEVEPDLLSACVEATFGRPGENAAGWLDAIEAESATFAVLERYHPQNRNTGSRAYFRLCGDTLPEQHGTRRGMVLALWHCVLWEYAGRVAPAEAAARLARWWRAPDAHSSDQTLAVFAPLDPAELERLKRDVGVLLLLRGTGTGYGKATVEVSAGSVNDIDADVAAAVYSPWLGRVAIRDQHRKKSTSVSDNYPLAGQPAAFIRLLSAVHTVTSVMRGAFPCDEFLELLLHGADVLTESRIHDQLKKLRTGRVPKNRALRDPIAGLALYVLGVEQRAGGGRLPEIHPRKLAEFLVRASDPEQSYGVAARPEESRKLLTIAAHLTASEWIQDVSSAGGDPADDDLQGRWFKGESGPEPAYVVISTAMERVRDWMERNPRDERDPDGARPELEVAKTLEIPALLSVELGYRVDRSPWSWQRTIASTQDAISFRRVLLSERLPVERWLGDRMPETRIAKSEDDRSTLTRIALLTERLAALFAGPAGSPANRFEEWLDDWLNAVEAIHDVEDLSRSLRIRMIQLLDLPADARVPQDIRRQALETMVYLIAEFGGGTPRDYRMMFERLAQSGDKAVLPSSLLNDLRYQWLYAIQQRHLGFDQRSEVRSPWVVHGRSRSHQLTDAMTRRFVYRVAPANLEWSGDSLGHKLTRLWHELRKAPPYTLVEHETADADIDLRRTVSIVVDRTNDKVRTLTVPELLTRTADTAEEVHDRFAAHAEPSKGYSLGVGVVCGPGVEDRILINCGTGAGIAAPSSPGVSPGDLVGVRLRAQDAASEVVRRLALEPQPGVVRWASLDLPGFQDGNRVGSVTISVEQDPVLHRDATVDEAEFTRRWDPDISRGFGRPTIEQVDVEAQWSEHDNTWLPVDRSMPELLAAKMRFTDANGGPAEVLVVVGPVVQPHGWSWRVCTSPGLVYVLTENDFLPADRQRLQEQWLQEQLGSKAFEGLLLHVGLVEDGGKPVLRLLAEPPVGAERFWPNPAAGPFDDRNLRWREFFRRPDHVVNAHYDDGRYVVDLVELDFGRGHAGRRRPRIPHDDHG
ncbi:MAG TPA: hypothetical protein VFC19_05685 [Candidatus Limnocylindrales bacterium]|nr:hypothetical protein [Candidatus Limnocylindrales bacterium]